MPTPGFTFRLSPERAASLREMAKVYGSPNTSVFLREMVEAMCSGEITLATAFLTRLVERAGEQLTLQFNASLENGRVARKRARKPRKERKGVLRAT